MEEEPAYKLLAEYPNFGEYVFDDDTFGVIVDYDFDYDDFLEYDDRDEDAWFEQDDGHLEVDGKLAAGYLYIDRWTRDGEFIQGDCFFYYVGETFADYCLRNGEPFPMWRLPPGVIDAFRAEDLDALEQYYDDVPELRKCPPELY